MKNDADREVELLLDWCASALGPCELLSDQTREHAGRRASALRLRAAGGNCYVKLHRDAAHWMSEVHGYEQWAPAFGARAPRLLAVRDVEPLALVISELPGTALEETPLPAAQERATWRAAGQALAGLHNLAVGEYFGPCRRDGSPLAKPIDEAQAFITAAFDDLEARGLRGGFLTAEDRAAARAARQLIPAFAGERPAPCHRDYCPPNWLVSRDGTWTGVIDFEFSYWDVRSTDFSRLPNWEWVHRPDLLEAFFEGYGRSFTPAEEQQRLVTHTLYALGAVVWGLENDYHVFAGEGRRALRYLAGLLE